MMLKRGPVDHLDGQSISLNIMLTRNQGAKRETYQRGVTGRVVSMDNVDDEVRK
jgi:hypothetical protein